MADKEKDKDKLGEDGGEDEGKESIVPQLLQYIFEPDDDRLPDLTDMPLNQVNPLTWLATFEAAENDLVKRMTEIGKAREKAVEEGGAIGKIKFEPVSLSNIWRKYYYKHRRSLEGAGLFRAAQLANKQLETQEMQAQGGEEREL